MTPKPKSTTRWFMRLGDERGNLVVEFFPHWPDPGCWGVILADVAHHAAEAYCQRSGTFDPRPILREILRVMRLELVNPATRRTCLAVQATPETNSPAGGERTRR